MFLQFETNNYCNARCSMCPHKFMEKRHPISDSLISKILDECLPMVNTVMPFLYQEPLMETRFIQILKEIKHKKPNVFTVVHSNMALMTDRLAEDILKNNLVDYLYVSFYGPTPQIYEKYQPPLKWARTKETIIKFIERRNDYETKKPHICMEYISTKDLMEKYDMFKSEWENIADQVRIVPFSDFCGSIKGFEPINKPKSPRKTCDKIFKGINILCDGTVVPCCLDYNGTVSLGNISNQHITEIIYGPNMNQLKVANLKKDWKKLPVLCKRCNVFGIDEVI
jgi:MoaA/NifB/PqqE/SkfB family radical SAM enzyme